MNRLIRVLRTRTAVLCLVVFVLGGLALRHFSRVELVSDLGSGGEVSVRFAASSPWFSGAKSLVQFSSSDKMRSPGVVCSTATFYRNNVPVHKGVSMILDAQPGRETTVSELTEQFEQRIDRDDFPVRVLEYGDPEKTMTAKFRFRNPLKW